MKRWWQLEIKEVERLLEVDASHGLSSQEAKKRIDTYGPNQLKEKEPLDPLALFFEQFRDFIIWVLIGAALISGFLQEWIDALAIIAIVILNAVVGFIQEYRAEKSLAALRKLSSPTSKVLRQGESEVMPSSELVPGDIIELEAGDHIPADGRLVSMTANFAAQEASLTGESTPVAKTVLALEEEDVPLADRASMVYTGTSVASGKARVLVVDTGMRTELGKIAGMIQEIVRESTPLQKKLERFGKWIVKLCFVLVALVFFLGLLRGGPILDMFLTAVSLAVAAIPEGLPAVVTIALALGVQRMVRRHVLIRKLPSVETLGCATVICSDKTGTLTKNEMTVQAVFAGGALFSVTGVGYEPRGGFLRNGKPANPEDSTDLKKSLLCGVLCNGAQLVHSANGYAIVGDPTEGALLTAGAKANIWKERSEESYPFVEEIPFDSVRKKMTIMRRDRNLLTAFVKGAPDVLLNDCSHIEESGSRRAISIADKTNILSANMSLTNQAMRVLAVACRTFERSPDVHEAKSIERDLTFVGLIAMIDPPRDEVKEAITKCEGARIKTVMITGDHKNTAVAIARELGFFGEGSLAFTGEDLDRMKDGELQEDVDRISVYARVSPEHKLRIVRMLKKRGHVVAMTGDGVNDAPAVKEADIGVAMGITGTDVTKEVSDMVITDDNFASIVAAVEEGRGIYENIQKFIHYLLSCNVGEILVMFVSTLLGLPVPLLPIQILWVNLVTDGLPALALGLEPVDPKVMMKSPRWQNEAVVTRGRALLMLGQGSFIALCSLLAFIFVLFIEQEGIGRGRTAAFIVLSCAQLVHSVNCRNMTESLFKIGVTTNGKLILAVLISFLMQIIVVYVPFLRAIFKTEPLGLFDWVFVIAVSSFPLWAMEAVKLVRKSRHPKAFS
jgi:Ca2+-transporting ATPase